MGMQDAIADRVQSLTQEGKRPGEVRQNWGADTAQLYADRGIGSNVGFGTWPCLLIIDMANAFTDPSYKLGTDLSEVVGGIDRLLQTFRSAGLPVIYTTTAYEKDLRDAGTFGIKIPALAELQLGSEAVEIDPRIAPLPDETVLVKKFGSAFFMTNLAALLITHRVDTVVATGVSTSGCVRASVIDACSYGFRTVVPVEAVGDRAEGPHWANLFDMDVKYADVVRVDDVIQAITAVQER